MQEDIIEVSKHNLTKYIFVILIWDACMTLKSLSF